MARIEAKLSALGLTLPPLPQLPPGVVLPFQFVRVLGNRVLISGHGPQNRMALLRNPSANLGAMFRSNRAIPPPAWSRSPSSPASNVRWAT